MFYREEIVFLYKLQNNRKRSRYLLSNAGLLNRHASLYVVYCGWEYGFPEKSLPENTNTKTRLSHLWSYSSQ